MHIGRTLPPAAAPLGLGDIFSGLRASFAKDNSVEMPDSKEASSAIRQLDGMVVNERRLVVKEARTRDQRKSSRW